MLVPRHHVRSSCVQQLADLLPPPQKGLVCLFWSGKLIVTASFHTCLHGSWLAADRACWSLKLPPPSPPPFAPPTKTNKVRKRENKRKESTCKACLLSWEQKTMLVVPPCMHLHLKSSLVINIAFKILVLNLKSLSASPQKRSTFGKRK